MSPFLRSLGSKPVHDGEGRPVGRILASEVDPTFGQPLALLVELGPEAPRGAPDANGDDDPQAELATLDAAACWLSFDRVRSIRRDAIRLDETLPRLLDERDRQERRLSVITVRR